MMASTIIVARLRLDIYGSYFSIVYSIPRSAKSSLYKQLSLYQTTMAIQFLLLLLRQGKVRLSKWYQTILQKEKSKITRELTTLVLARRAKMCNVLEYKNIKIVYRRYALLFFVVGIDTDDNELLALEIVHRFVEQMDRMYGNVCELDIIFGFDKAYHVLDELLLDGYIQELLKKEVLRRVAQQDELENMDEFTSVLA